MAKPDNEVAGTGTPSALVSFIATGGGSGNLPVAPGTWGSLVALPCAAGLHILGGPWLLSLAILLAFVAGVWASGRYADAIGRSDPGSVVIDEFAGQWLAILPVALDWRYYIVAFVLFRFTDITKPWPCRMAERAPGGLGIMLDDIVAGVYAGILTLLIAVWLGLEHNLPSLPALFG
ncbi:MAG: phosphatidylglycerophosphatase A [Alphaproteobacteria bacterium]|nr:phosphatidylglycerophosphatase A [Alphaproteobacteria bacterium]